MIILPIFLFCHSYSYEDVQTMAQEILKYSSLRPKIGIICGTGLGGLAQMLEKPVEVPYEMIPGFPLSTGMILIFFFW